MVQGRSERTDGEKKPAMAFLGRNNKQKKIMTKEEFQNHKDPLVMIVSFDPSTGKSIWDTYDWRAADGFMEDFKRDFPKHIHFRTMNKSGIAERKKSHGLVSTE